LGIVDDFTEIEHHAVSPTPANRGTHPICASSPRA
jgi:hypothetical protein